MRGYSIYKNGLGANWKPFTHGNTVVVQQLLKYPDGTLPGGQVVLAEASRRIQILLPPAQE